MTISAIYCKCYSKMLSAHCCGALQDYFTWSDFLVYNKIVSRQTKRFSCYNSLRWWASLTSLRVIFYGTQADRQTTVTHRAPHRARALLPLLFVVSWLGTQDYELFSQCFNDFIRIPNVLLIFSRVSALFRLCFSLSQGET